MIGCWCDESFIAKLDRARGSRTRSQFCREAIADKLRAMGMDVPEQETISPDRKGKGGPRRALYRLSRYKAELNESPAKSGAGSKSARKK